MKVQLFLHLEILLIGCQEIAEYTSRIFRPKMSLLFAFRMATAVNSSVTYIEPTLSSQYFHGQNMLAQAAFVLIIGKPVASTF